MNTFNTMVRRAKRGDAEAFIGLIEACRMTLRRVALGYLRNDEDVADVMQDTILDAFEHISSLKKEEYFKTWIVRILINRCTKKYRSNQRKAYLEDYSEEAVSDVGKAEVEFREMLSVLPDDSRIIFQLYFGEQFSIKEIAQILEMNENPIKSRLHRGKEQLRVSLEGKALAAR
ncbi:MAG: sigma-70 family RNA polymerase sigma factor, partial [Lachnospiraceae bacterium]|nr:sigma-70 family RNA polymerase sigma factor [Lachnospiraceae bacterium]